MKTVEYCIEHKLKDEPFYQKSFSGFKDRLLALKLADSYSKESRETFIERTRVVKQERRTIKVFKQ